jgi:hypothetical protein
LIAERRKMVRRRAPFIAIVAAVASLGCGVIQAEETPTEMVAPTLTPTAWDGYGLANVESIDILLLESFPVQVRVVARGNHPDGCTSIESVDQTRDERAFLVTIATFRPPDAICTQEIVPFEETIALDVLGLPAGAYSVDVNGISGTFELAVDNVMAEQEASIGGVVWHDECATPWGEAPATPPEGCVSLPDGGYEANGVLEPGEPGLAGVVVMLGEGACPSTGTATATTGADGSYLFTGLGAGTYCVSVNALDPTNEAILVPGGWTSPPGDGLAGVTVSLEEGESNLEVNFGWDFQFLPSS